MNVAPPSLQQGLRILHTPHNIAGGATIFAEEMRALNTETDALCYASKGIFRTDLQLPTNASHWEKLRTLIWAAAKYDVFIFWYGQSLLGESLLEVPLLKRLGKTVVFYFVGCDIRNEREVTRSSKVSACEACFPKLCSRNRDLARETAERYADIVYVSTPDLMGSITNAKLLLQPFNRLSSVPSSPPRTPNSRFRIAHAPSSRQIKGTSYLLKAVQHLRDEGHDVELDLIENVSNDAALLRYAQADLAVDQLLIGTYGTFAVECMALGIPVLCYLDERYIDKYPAKPPIISSSPLEITDRLREVITGQFDLIALSQQATKYVSEFHSGRRLAEQVLADLLKHRPR